MSGIRAIRALLRGGGPTRWVSVEHDTVITDPQDGDVLRFVGDVWINVPSATQQPDGPPITRYTTATGSGASLTFEHAMANGDNRRLLVVVASEMGNDASSVTYGGQEMVEQIGGSLGDPTAYDLHLYTLSGAPTGVNDVIVTWSEATPSAVIAVSLLQARQDDGGGFDGSSLHDVEMVYYGSGTTPSETLDSQAGDVCLIFALVRPNPIASLVDPLVLLDSVSFNANAAHLYAAYRPGSSVGTSTVVAYTVPAPSEGTAYIAIAVPEATV